MAGRLDGLHAVITGAANGIGLTAARRFVDEGARVSILDIDVAAGESAAAELGRGTRFLACDLTHEDQVNAAFDAIARSGPIDVLINNAGYYPLEDWDAVTTASWDRVMAVNVRSAFLCCKAVTAPMRANGGGSIINLCSAVVFSGARGFPHYVAAKGAILGLTRALALELGPDTIRVNAIAPGLVLTETVLGDRPLEAVDANASQRALARRGYPEDLTGTLVYLASPDSAFVTGQTIVIDGGRVTH